MKKLLTITAVLLTAVLFLSSCNNASGGSDDDEKLPGNWKNTASYYDAGTFNAEYVGGTVTSDGAGTVIYSNPTPKQPARPLEQGYFTHDAFKFSKDLDLTGFEGTASCTSPNSTYGFLFNIDSQFESYYEIVFQNSGFKIKKRLNGESPVDIKEWEDNKAIKNEPAENKVTVYKKKNSIVIQVNGTTIYTIKDPELTMGSIGYSCGLGYDDIKDQVAIKTTYKISKVQF